MGRAVPLRKDFTGDELRRLSRCTSDGKQIRRLLALALIYDGASRTQAARHAHVDLQSIRDWVLRFNAEGPDGLIDRKSSGAPSRLNAVQRAALVRAVEAGPISYLDGVVRWRLSDLVGWVHAEFGVTMDETTLGRNLRAMGYRKLSARPCHHAQDPEASLAFKKTSRTKSRKSEGGCGPTSA